jgi:uncharacterized protein (AIM24 family)
LITEFLEKKCNVLRLSWTPQETVIAESGSFMFMDDGIEMATIFGDGSNSGGSGVFGKLLSAGKRLLTGESLFMTALPTWGRVNQP